ncbi:hypothetical protein DFH09DRAFT_1326260 [Mycena vulgaris]|nr:hypothetical protein DFH09DRAFT_1326260 [Mycena vulgaris]
MRIAQLCATFPGPLTLRLSPHLSSRLPTYSLIIDLILAVTASTPHLDLTRTTPTSPPHYPARDTRQNPILVRAVGAFLHSSASLGVLVTVQGLPLDMPRTPMKLLFRVAEYSARRVCEDVDCDAAALALSIRHPLLRRRRETVRCDPVGAYSGWCAACAAVPQLGLPRIFPFLLFHDIGMPTTVWGGQEKLPRHCQAT